MKCSAILGFWGPGIWAPRFRPSLDRCGDGDGGAVVIPGVIRALHRIRVSHPLMLIPYTSPNIHSLAFE